MANPNACFKRNSWLSSPVVLVLQRSLKWPTSAVLVFFLVIIHSAHCNWSILLRCSYINLSFKNYSSKYLYRENKMKSLPIQSSNTLLIWVWPISLIHSFTVSQQIFIEYLLWTRHCSSVNKIDNSSNFKKQIIILSLSALMEFPLLCGHISHTVLHSTENTLFPFLLLLSPHRFVFHSFSWLLFF